MAIQCGNKPSTLYHLAPGKSSPGHFYAQF
nr:MAG TPA: hypothetical protein [Caudoviricetes sp.]